jgi:3-mercaptopyruvate sulfurtransferase SseA
VVTDSEVRGLIKSNRLLNLGENVEEAEARDVAAGIVAKRVQKEYGVKHTVVFARSIRASKEFREQQDKLNDLGPHAENFHVDSGMSAGERSERLNEFKEAPRALMTNARCLTEGVDVPDIDCVDFAAPKQSMIDIVQAAGRAMRKVEGKKFGYIIIPLVVPDNVPFEEFAETTPFRTVVKIINSLSTQDERIVEELRAMYCGPTSKSKKKPKGVIKIGGTVSVGFRMSLDELADAITTRVWDAVARVNWLPFGEARAFAQSLQLQNSMEWHAYCASGRKPANIPSNVSTVYADKGWVSFPDWLGYDFLPFEEARAFVHSLGLETVNDFRTYCKSGKNPANIPVNPSRYYADKGWVDWPDWLGRERRPKLLPFNEARAFARSLGLKTANEWFIYCQSGKKPANIPTAPYQLEGWVNWADWLGNGKADPLPFEEARAFVRSLGLKSESEWRAYYRSGKKPANIPSSPGQFYADKGWVDWPDWLGYERPKLLPFEEARAFVRSLGLKSVKEWDIYCRSGKKPANIPITADAVYADKGWMGWQDWMGYERGSVRVERGSKVRVPRDWLPFEEARAFARSLRFKSAKEWQAWSNTGSLKL